MRRIYTSILFLIVYLASCKSDKDRREELPDTPARGTITISADESFQPIVDELIKVYESNNSGTKINVQYKPEADCIKDLWNDSIRMVISTIVLTDGESRKLSDSLKVVVDQLPVARDAIAVIMHPDARETEFDMDDIKKVLAGTYSRPLVPVFDGVKATSSVRYIVDSVMKGAKLTNRAVAARTSDSVINYVAKHPDAIGFVGVSWMGNPSDDEQSSFLKKVKICRLKSTDSTGNYILPVQANLYGRVYPMTRDLTYIVKERYRGLGTGFAELMATEIGQLIFKRAYLMPGRRYYVIRPIQLNEDSI